MIYLSLSFDGNVNGVRRAAIDAAARGQGGSAIWRTSKAAERSYALLEVPDEAAARAIPSSGAAAYAGAIIAIAVYPAVPEALPKLLDAFGGAGRPAGVLACRPVAKGLVIEWDPERSGARLVLGLVDVELERFHSGRTTEVLSPLPPSVVAAVAAEGLEAPQIEPERILELRIDRA